jgi:ketosteroid isomerase-like protein
VSEQNVELHRRAVEAFNARDVEAVVALCDPNIEFHAMPAPRGGVYHGHDGVRRWLGDLEEAWGDEIRIDPEAYFDLGERTVVFNMLHARGRQSGVQVEMPSAQVVRWRDGLGVYVKVYVHREDALEDLGVSEDALEPIAP